MQPIFKVGDKVYHYFLKWGTIIDINKNIDTDIYPIKVSFNSGIEAFGLNGSEISNRPPTLSFTEYNFITGGFSQVRPRPDLKPGDLIWVCGNYTDWMYRRFSHWSENGVLTTSQLYDLPLIECPNWSIECPVTSPPPPPSPREISQA